MAIRGINKIATKDSDEHKSNRNAGILLHITSLPSMFGIGDFGPESKNFVDFLVRSKQRYWQLLPLNPISQEQAYSPYSSISSMAGNVLLISPDQLVADGLLTIADVKKYKIKPGSVDFQAACSVRDKLLTKAASIFFAQSKGQHAFRRFCEREAYWLNDFALYQVLRKFHRNRPWYEWPKEFRLRREETLSIFSKEVKEDIRYSMFEQFVFFSQWRQLKSYASSSQIQLFGDLPFYVSYDSADVWANRKIFNVDKDGIMKGVAGVPPDYFNKNGQLWGMPTFKWDVLKSMKYDWWIKRIRKNMELFDLLRLDHFRAFADYWEVPADHTTAIKGKWKPGPGIPFFATLQNSLGALPFVAEDLGDVNDAVFRLRDHFNLPGMKILQFAYGDNMASSSYIPHHYTQNFIAYTGTHDNNTVVGWFTKEISMKTRKQIASYVGQTVSEENIHIALSRLAYASVAKTAILPLQDVLGLDETARMNMPASTMGNWRWRLKPGVLTKSLESLLHEWVTLYNR